MMGNSFVTRNYELSLPEPLPATKSAEMPANRPNVAKYMPGDKSAKFGKQTKPKTLRHHRWLRKKKRSAS